MHLHDEYDGYASIIVVMLRLEFDEERPKDLSSFILLDNPSNKPSHSEKKPRAHSAADVDLSPLSQQDPSFDSLFASLTKALHCLRNETESVQLIRIKDALETLNETGVIWSVPVPEASDHVWKRFIQLYLSIPDCLSQVLDLFPPERMEKNCFFRTIAQRMPPQPSRRTVDVVQKSFSSGGLGILVETMLQRGLFESIRGCLQGLKSVYQAAFIRELLHYLNIQSTSNPLDLLSKVSLFVDLLPIENIVMECPLDIFGCIVHSFDLMATLSHASRLFEAWGILTSIEKAPLTFQRIMTRHLLVLLSYLSMDLLQRHSLERFLLSGIQRRLDSPDHEISLMGKVVGECYGTYANAETRLLFDLEETNKMVQELRESFFFGRLLDERIALQNKSPIVIGKFSFNLMKDEDDVNGQKVDKPLSTLEPIIESSPLSNVVSSDRLPLMKITKRDEEARNARIKRPRFLRDALAYIKCSDDPVKLELGFQELNTCFNVSSQILREELAQEIYRAVLFIGDTFNIKDLNIFRLDMLTRLTMELPSVIGKYAVDELVGRYASLGQKLEIMTTCMRALRQISTHPPMTMTSEQKRTNDIKLRLLDRQIGFKRSVTMESKLVQTRGVIRHFVIPLLIQFPTAQSKAFNEKNSLFLEKTLCLLAISLHHSSNLLEFDELVSKAITFIVPILSLEHSSTSLPRTIIKALVVVFHTLVSLWPKSLSLILHYESLYNIFAFLDRWQDRLVDLETDYVSLTAATFKLLAELLDPQHILEEATSQMALEMSEVKIDQLKNLNHPMKLSK